MASMRLPPVKYTQMMLGKRMFCPEEQKANANLSLRGKTVMITGGSSGIGLACAKIIPSLGVEYLIITARSASRGEEAANSIRASHPSCKVEVWDLDMMDYNSIQALAGRAASIPRLDIAILNAGMYSGSESKFSKQTGHEESFQCNYLSTALLSILLLPVLKRKTPSDEPGQLTIVGSGTGLIADFPKKDVVPLIPTFDTPFNSFTAATAQYSLTKLLVMMFVAKIGEAVNGNDVTINTVEPGLTSGTGLHRDTSGGGAMGMALMKKIGARTPEQGAWTYIDAVGKGVKSHGGLILAMEVSAMNAMMYTPEGKQTTNTLWEETLSELRFAGVREILQSMSPKN